MLVLSESEEGETQVKPIIRIVKKPSNKQKEALERLRKRAEQAGRAREAARLK